MTKCNDPGPGIGAGDREMNKTFLRECRVQEQETDVLKTHYFKKYFYKMKGTFIEKYFLRRKTN